MLYEIPLSWVENHELLINKYLRKWLGLSKNISSVALYCTKTPCPLPLTSFVSEFKKRKVGALKQLKDSIDPLIKSSVPTLNTGRKWKVADALRMAEHEVDIGAIQGVFYNGRSGFGSGYHKLLSDKQKVSKAIGKLNDDLLYEKAAKQTLQGQWTHWQNIIQRDFSFHSMLRMSPQLRSFAMGITYNTLASRSNLKRWGLLPDDSCPLCLKPKCTLQHVLSGCKTALADGRYRFRHDSILKTIAHFVQQHIDLQKRESSQAVPPMQDKNPHTASNLDKLHASLSKLLSKASDWVLLVDVKKQLVFPPHILSTKLRPDMVLYSQSTRRLIIIELTSPCEEHILVRHLEKTDKYMPLVKDCSAAGWATSFFAVEVGARGYVGSSLRKCFVELGISGKPLKLALNEVSDAACRASFWIWLRRDDEKEKFSSSSSNSFQTRVSAARDLIQRKHGFSKSSKRPSVPSAQKVHGNTAQAPSGKRQRCPSRSARVASKSHRGPAHTEENEVDPRQNDADRSSLVLVPRGIHNVANSCFMGSVLQFMKSFSMHLLPSGNQSLISSELSRCLSDLSSRNPQPLYPLSFSTVSRRHFNFADSSFEDAHEYITGLLLLFDQSPFQFSVSHSISCLSCDYSSYTCEPYFELQLPLSASSLTGCISAFQQPARLQDWKCPTCQILGNNEESFQIVSYPPVLLVVLKRFAHSNGRTTKLNNQVQWDEVLHLGGSKYCLMATISHHNSINSGHYTANVKSSGRWFKCNDASVTAISPTNKSSEVYLLAFEKTE